MHHKGFHAAVGLHTWQTQALATDEVTLRITALPARHAPGAANLVMPSVMGSLLQFENRAGEPLMRIYISGDTLLFDQIAEIARRYPEPDLALLHLGGTRVLGLMVTMDGKQGARMLDLIAPRTAIPIHYDDYDVFKSSLGDFQRAVRAAGWENRVRYLSRGDSYTFLAAPRPR